MVCEKWWLICLNGAGEKGNGDVYCGAEDIAQKWNFKLYQIDSVNVVFKFLAFDLCSGIIP